MENNPFLSSPPDFHVRIEKLKFLRSLNIEPYPHIAHPTQTIEELVKSLDLSSLPSMDEINETHKLITLCGRIMLHRHMGKIIFVQLQEECERIQLIFVKNHTTICEKDTDQSFEIIKKYFDLGDWLEATGYLCKTKKGEPSIVVASCRILCKSLLPLPDKHNKLTNKELLLRKRWLDLLSYPSRFERFRLRSHIIKEIRKVMEDSEFLEVETPIIQNRYGGAEANPFVTKIAALKQNAFLRIALELPLKKLLVGGFRRIFELSKVFRNEGIDRSHNPEFTLMEAYAAYWDYNMMMDFVENLFKIVSKKVLGTTVITINECTVDLEMPWKRMTMKEAIYKYGDIDIDKMDNTALKNAVISKEEIPVHETSRGLLIAQIFELYAESFLIQPHHIIDHPIETTPLCKPKRDTSSEEIYVERFESFIGGGEICNSYSELNDPLLQKQLLTDQNKGKNSYDIDEEFIESIFQGMPPAAGIGIGIDRMVMLLTNGSNMKDVIFFPMMKEASSRDGDNLLNNQ